MAKPRYANVTVLDHPLIQHKLSLMRDKTTSTSASAFCCARSPICMCYEVTRDLELETLAIETPMGPMNAPVHQGQEAGVRLDPARRQWACSTVCSISCLRHASPISASIATTRRSSRSNTISRRPTTSRTAWSIVVDPMLATGNSGIAAIDRLKRRGANRMRFLCLLSAPEGIAAFTKAHPDVPVFTAAIDSHLNEKGYIVPGPRRCRRPDVRDEVGASTEHFPTKWLPGSTKKMRPSNGINAGATTGRR